MTFYNKSSPVSWNRGGGGRATLNKKVLLGGRVALSKD